MLHVIRQTEAAECGLACLCMVAHHHGQQVDLTSLRRRHPISMKGATLPHLPGMALTADVILEERSFAEWLLEPLLSIRGRTLPPPAPTAIAPRDTFPPASPG